MSSSEVGQEEGTSPPGGARLAAEREAGARRRRSAWRASIAAVLLACAVGAGLASFLGSLALREVGRDAQVELALLGGRVEAAVSEVEHVTRLLAGDPRIAAALTRPDGLAAADAALVGCRDAFEGSVCYVLDASGRCVASSNREEPRSFVGHDYGFRPYFRKALERGSGRYWAQGQTSGSRGYYASWAVRGTGARPLGVVVIKMPVEGLEGALAGVGIAGLADPRGFLFLASRPDLRYRTLWPLSPAEVREFRASRQFGAGPGAPLSAAALTDGQTVRFDGRRYLFRRRALGPDGWSLVALRSLQRVSASQAFGAGAGALVGCAFLVSSLAQRRKREAARVIARSEARLRTVLDHTDNALLALDDQRRVAFYNERYAECFGVPRELLESGARLEELLGWACRQGLYPAEREAELVAKRLSVLSDARGSCAIDVPRSDGRVTEAYVTPLPGGGHLLAYRDVTGRRRAEEALREAKEFAERLVGGTAIATFVLDTEHRVLLWNPACEALTGMPAAEVTGTNLHWRAFYEESRPCLADLVLDGREAAARDLYEDSGESALTPHALRAAGWYDRLGGKRRYIAFDAAPIFGRDGRLLAAVETIQDITALKQAEEQLARLGAAVEQTAEAIVVTDVSGATQYANPAFERVTGYSLQDLLEASDEGGGGAAGIPEEAWPALRRGEVWFGEGRRRRKDGTTYHEEATVSPVRDSQGRVVDYVAVRRDVSQEADLRRRLAQSQRLEALGTLAGGIAHDFNNILTAIVGFTEMTRDDLPEGTQGRENLDRVLAAGDRARDLVRQILAFSRPGAGEREPVLVAPVVTETLRLLHATLPKTVAIREELRAPDAAVLADAIQLQQVILNLCTNASQAMAASGGTLSVTLEEEVGSPGEVGEPDWVVLTVRDSGPGIAPEHLDRVFEPFFTTKEVGQGTGMGLSVVHGIVLAHGGEITVASPPGEGAVFRVRLPRAQGAAWGASDESAPPLGSGERILLVDDEAALTNLGEKTLRRLGYEVEAFNDPLGALERFRGDPDAFDLLLTDQSMPGLPGIELAAAVRAARPDLPVVLCTGYSRDADGEGAAGLGVSELVWKPFSVRTLSGAVQRALGAGAAH